LWDLDVCNFRVRRLEWSLVGWEMSDNVSGCGCSSSSAAVAVAASNIPPPRSVSDRMDGRRLLQQLLRIQIMETFIVLWFLLRKGGGNRMEQGTIEEMDSDDGNHETPQMTILYI